ncbi:hypothetical protein Esti_000199 [Eimeria stiedai]
MADPAAAAPAAAAAAGASEAEAAPVRTRVSPSSSQETAEPSDSFEAPEGPLASDSRAPPSSQRRRGPLPAGGDPSVRSMPGAVSRGFVDVRAVPLRLEERGPPYARAPPTPTGSVRGWWFSRRRGSPQAAELAPLPSSTSSNSAGAGRIHLLHYSGVILTAMVLFPLLVGGHLLSPNVVSLAVLLLPACAAFSQALPVPAGSGCCCLPLSRRSWAACMARRASKFKALVTAFTLAPVTCVAVFLVDQAWAAHLSLLPAIVVLLVVWPRLWCLLILCAQIHLELILSNAYIFTVPYAGSSSWFVCAVFAAAICLFPAAVYMSLKAYLVRSLSVSVHPRERGVLHLTHLQQSLLALCVCWGLADVLLMVNLFFLHFPVSPLPADLRALRGLFPAAAAESPEAEVQWLRRQLRTENVVLASAAFAAAICGVCTLVLVLQWSKASLHAQGVDSEGMVGGGLGLRPAPPFITGDPELSSSTQARRCHSAEQKAKFEFVKAHINIGKVQQGDSGIADGCSICQDAIKVGDEAVRLPACGHGFHWSCLSCWFSRRLTCPNCQLDVYKGLVRDLELAGVTPEQLALPRSSGRILPPPAAARAAASPPLPRTRPAAATAAAAAASENTSQRTALYGDVLADLGSGWVDVELGPTTIGAQPRSV